MIGYHRADIEEWLLNPEAWASRHAVARLANESDVTMMVEKADTGTRVRVHEMKDGPEGQEGRLRFVPYALTETSEHPTETSTETSTCIVEILSETGLAKPPLERLKKIRVKEAAALNDLSEASFRRHYGHLIRKITPRRDAVELGDAINLPPKPT
jgi:hypothetical protein